MLFRNQKGLGAIGATIATALGMTLLAGGSKLYVNTKASEAVTNEMRKRGEVVQQNASAFTDKLLRGGVIEEQNGDWQLQGTVPAATWSFAPAVTELASAPIISFNFCDPAKILSGQESVETCVPTVLATTTILGRDPAGKVNLSNYSLITKAAKQMESRGQSRLSGVPGCREYNGTALVGHLFRSVLGREPTTNELENIMPCVASGNLQPWDLESANTGLCGGLVSGLRALPEYDRRREAVYAAFRSNVGRMPGPGDSVAIATYLEQLNVPDASFISALQSVAAAIRTDYALGSEPFRPHLLNDLYEVIAQGAFLPIDVATNAYLPLLASGSATLLSVTEMMRQASWYRSENPEIDLDWAKHSEGMDFLYYALTGKHLNQLRLEWGVASAHPFDVANFYGYHAWLVDAYHTDPTLNGYQWTADQFRFSGGLDFEAKRVNEAGICGVPAPKAQCVVASTNLQSSSFWNAGGSGASGYIDGKLCGTPPNHIFVPNTQNCPTAKPQQYFVNYNQYYWTIKIPKPETTVATLSTKAYAFGYLSTAGHGGASFPANALPNAFSTAYSAGRSFTNLGSGQLVTDSCVASGMGGANSFNYSYNIPPLKRSCLVTTTTRFSNIYYADAAARNSSNLLMEWHAWVPAPAIATIGGTDASYRYVIPNPGDPYPPSAADLRRYSAGVPETIRMGQHAEPSGTPFMNWEILRNAEFPLVSGGMLGPNLMINISGGGYFFDAPLRYHPIPKYFKVDGNTYNMRTDSIDYLSTQLEFRNQAAWGSPDCQYSTTTISPLVVDLFNDGIEFTKPIEGVTFDLGDGPGSSYYWVANGEKSAFLALDKNSNGKIESIQELFGDRTVREDGTNADNGFIALQDYDLNRDRKIDSRDPVFRDLVLWFDRNHNGVTERGELRPISLAGIKAVDLDFLSIDELADKYGNLSKQRAVAEMQDGSFRKVFDIYVVPNPIAH